MKVFSLKSVLALGTILAGIQAAPALAQQAEGTAAGDIIVTARRVEERLQDVPISITVFNQEQITNRNIVNAADLAAFTPSLSADTRFGSTNTAFALRGFVQDVGTAPSVGVYFADVVAPRGAANNVPIGDGAGPGNFFDLQNVQVLKGPQGTLFGRNTTGGAVILVPQRPTDRLEGYVEGSYGNYDMRRFQAVLNIPLADTFKVRLGVDRQKRDGYLRNTSGIGPGRFNDVDYLAARASILAELTPDLENYTVASYLRSDTHGDLQKLVACNSDITSPLGNLACNQLDRAVGNPFYTVQNGQTFQDARTLLTQWQIINTTTWRANDTLTVKNIVSYAQLEQFFKNALFGTDFIAPQTIFGFPLPGAGQHFTFSGINPLTNGLEANQSTFTEEFRLEGQSPDQGLVWQAGAYFESAVPLSKNIGTVSPIFVGCGTIDSSRNVYNCTNPIQFPNATFTGLGPAIGGINYNQGTFRFRNVGLYAQASYKLSEQLKLTGGIRYTWDRARSESNLGKIGIPDTSVVICPLDTSPGFCPTLRYEKKSRAPTWLIGLDFKPTEDMLLYAKYARGYRAGGITPNVPPEVAVFDPEKVDSYEAGLKTTFRGAVNGTFNVAAFYNNFSNQQLQLSVDPKPAFVGSIAGATGIFNVGKSRLWGIEVESSISPFAGFTVDGSYTYLNTKIRSIAAVSFAATSPFQPAAGIIQPGDPILLTPKHKLALTGTYTLPFDDSVGTISLGATLTYSSRQLSNYVNRLATDPAVVALGTLPSRALVNLNLNWRSVAGLPVDLLLFATNVTKKKYYTLVSGLYRFTGFETAAVGEPRMFGARLRYRFGD